MEIVDYLRIARRRIWVLVGIPLAAAIVTTLLVLLSPAQFTATATVSGPALVGGAPYNQFNGSQAVSQFVSAFQSTAQGPTVRQEVSTATGVATGKISAGLAVSQVGASSSMSLTYQSTNKKDIVPVLTSVVKTTLTNLFGSQVTLAQQQITDATADLTKANEAITAWEQTNHMVDPDALYQAEILHLNNLQQQQATLQANGKPSGSAVIASQIASVRAGMLKYAPLLAEYDVLTSARDSASASLTNAQGNLLGARSQLGAANPSTIAYITGEHQVNDGSALLTKVLPVTGAAIFAAIALIAIMELLAGSRAARSTGTEERDEQEVTSEAAKDEHEPIEPTPVPEQRAAVVSASDAEPVADPDDRVDDEDDEEDDDDESDGSGSRGNESFATLLK